MSKASFALFLVALAVLILWRLGSKTPSAVSFTEEAMVLRGGKCTEAIPLKKVRRQSLVADVLTIERTVATLYNGGKIVDERVSMPANYTFGTALDALVTELFGLQNLRTLAKNGKMVLYEGEGKEGSVRVLALFGGTSDLELLYPLDEEFSRIVKRCLIEGKPLEGPRIFNRVVEKEEERLPVAKWDRRLFDLEIIVNKDM